MSLVSQLPAIFDNFSDARGQGCLAAMVLKEQQIPWVGSYCTFMSQEVAMVAGAVGVSRCATCDGKTKMYECMAQFKPVHVMPLPNHADDEASRPQWRSEIVRCKALLKQHGQSFRNCEADGDYQELARYPVP